jgi:putative tricarboxylic transport membrane protein
MNVISTYRLFGFLITASFLIAAPIHAQTFPSKAIEVVVHTGPGGGSDLFVRAVADIIVREKLLPQPLVIMNRAGGGGVIAQNHVAGKRGDPYTIFAVVASLMVAIPIRSQMDIGLDKFQPLGLLGFDINCIAVRPDSPYTSAKELIEAARANPKSISLGLGAVGGASHYLPYMLEKMTGARFNMVSMKSGSEAVLAVMGGHVQATTEQLAEMTELVAAKKLRILGVASQQRLSGMPGVPTLKEQGFDLHIGGGRGFVAPAGIPAEAAAILETTLARVYRSQAWKDYMARNSYEDIYMGGTEFGNYLAAQQPRIKQYIQEMGLSGK